MKYIVLCEDKQTEVFFRRLLLTWGIGSRNISFETSPAGKGSGASFVLNNYYSQVNLIRSRNYLDTALIVAIDADNYSVRERLDQFKEILKEKNTSKHKNARPISTHERICHIIPKRNIETWLHYFEGASVSEETTYKHFEKQLVACKAAIKCLSSPQVLLPKNPPASLLEACKEIKRIFPDKICSIAS